ncbi:MAG: histidine kinase [Oscillospiraceae bacterium]|nr:histidine kinase [Oscillospiraceae bacterium]
MNNLSPKLLFWLCKVAGFSLLYLSWLTAEGNITGFFLLLFVIIMTLLRWRFKRIWKSSILFDVMLLLMGGEYIVISLILVSELFNTAFEQERERLLHLRDSDASRMYEMETMHSELTDAIAQVERMSIVSERTRISRDIHDNAGHEIVAAFISFQTLRPMLERTEEDVLELYDIALDRLDNGANKIREAVHNLSAVTELGVERLQKLCDSFPAHKVAFSCHGNSEIIPIYAWNMLESCLRECLTNSARHARPTYISVTLDVTPFLARLCVENDGVVKKVGKGSGLRNLQHRAVTIGGSIAIDDGEVFRVVCVVPLDGEMEE